MLILAFEVYGMSKGKHWVLFSGLVDESSNLFWHSTTLSYSWNGSNKILALVVYGQYDIRANRYQISPWSLTPNGGLINQGWCLDLAAQWRSHSIDTNDRLLDADPTTDRKYLGEICRRWSNVGMVRPRERRSHIHLTLHQGTENPSPEFITH